jgi:hypothetical protein
MAEAQIKVEAMRALVASKFGPEVSQPEERKNNGY